MSYVNLVNFSIGAQVNFINDRKHAGLCWKCYGTKGYMSDEYIGAYKTQFFIRSYTPKFIMRKQLQKILQFESGYSG